MLTLFRRPTLTLDTVAARFILERHGERLDVHDRAALHAARVAHTGPREGTAGAKVLQIWQDTATDENIAMVADGLEACEKLLARKLLDTRRDIQVARCTACEALADADARRCTCGGKLKRVRWA